MLSHAPPLPSLSTARRGLSRFARAFLVVAGCLLVLALPDGAAGQSRRGPAFERSIGRVPDSGLLNTPMGVAVSPGDPTRIFVVDYGNARIQVFRPVGRPDLGYWGSRGEGSGQFWKPMDVETSPDGRYVYVVDAGRARVMQYEIDRLCIGGTDIGCFNEVSAEWGSRGSGPGAFRSPTGLAVDRKGRVYVLDETAGVVQVFESDGSQPRILVDQSVGPERLSHPRDIEIGPEGHLWITDTENHRILVLNTDGELITQVTGGAERFHKPTGIAVAPDGGFIVRDFDPSYRTPRLWRFDAERRLVAPPMQLEGYDKRSRYPLQGVDFLPDGSAVVANPYAGIRQVGMDSDYEISLYLLPHGRNDLQPLAIRGRDPGQFAYPKSVAMGDRYVVVGDTDNRRIQILDGELGYLPSRVVGAPELPLEEISSVALFEGASAIDSRIYVADREANKVFVLDATGAVVGEWGDGRTREFNMPGGMAVDAAGNVYIADTNNRRIVKRSPLGEELASFGRDELSQPEALAIGPGGLIYVIERGQSRLTAYDDQGIARARWEAEPSDFTQPEPGELSQPVAISADDRYVYLLENAGYLHVRTQVLDPEPGRPLADSVVATFADSEGAGPGLVFDPFGIAAHPDGRVLIADSGNNRLQLYRWSGTAPTPSPSPTDEPTATATDEPTATASPAPTDPPTAEPTRGAPERPSPTPTEDRPTRVNPLYPVHLPMVVKHW